MPAREFESLTNRHTGVEWRAIAYFAYVAPAVQRRRLNALVAVPARGLAQADPPVMNEEEEAIDRVPPAVNEMDAMRLQLAEAMQIPLPADEFVIEGETLHWPFAPVEPPFDWNEDVEAVGAVGGAPEYVIIDEVTDSEMTESEMVPNEVSDTEEEASSQASAIPANLRTLRASFVSVNLEEEDDITQIARRSTQAKLNRMDRAQMLAWLEDYNERNPNAKGSADKMKK